MPVADEDLQRLEQSDLSLLETLDHVLNRGLVIAGEITISVADIDLIFVGLNLVVGSVETIRETLGQRAWIGRPAPDAAPTGREPAQPAREGE
jgi:Gas vesicle protein